MAKTPTSPPYRFHYPARLKNDAEFQMMSSAAGSGFREITDSMWMMGGRLPDNDDILFRQSGMTSREWRRERLTIRARLMPDGSGARER